MIIILVILIIIWFFSQPKLCGAMSTLGKNTKTDKCFLFSSTCLSRGYEEVNIDDCDCDNLEVKPGWWNKEICLRYQERHKELNY